MHAQLRSVRHYTAQQRSVVPCGAVRFGAVCPWLRCCVVLRCVLSFEHRAVPGMKRVVVYYFFLLYSFSTCIRSFTAPCSFPHANYPRTADQNVTPVTKAHSTAEHNNKAICYAQVALGIIKSLFAPNRGPHLSAAFTCF